MFDPKINVNVGFETGGRDATPTGVGALSSLIGDFLSVEAQGGSGGSNTPRLTEDEKFSADLRTFFDNKPPSATLDRNTAREFAAAYPQHGDKVFKLANDQGVVTNDPVFEAKTAALTDYSKDPEVIASVIAAEASGKDPEAAALQTIANRAREDADIAKLEREKTRYEAEGTLGSKRWETMFNSQRQFTDNVVQGVLGPIFRDVANGVPRQLTPEEQAQLGVGFDKVDMNNLPAVLQSARTFLVNQARNSYVQKFGQDVAMPADFETRVLAGIDALISQSKEFDSPQERANAMNALIEIQANQQLDAKGLTMANYFLKTLPPEVGTAILGENFATLNERFASLIIGDDNSVNTPEAISEAAANSSKGDAKTNADTAYQTIAAGGSTPEVFMAYTESGKRYAYEYTDGAAFTTIIGKSLPWMREKMSNDPQMRQYIQDWANSDISKHIAAIRRALPSGVSLSFQNGKFTTVWESTSAFGTGGGTQTRGASLTGYAGQGKPIEDTRAAMLKAANDALPKGSKVEDLNSKLAAIKLLGLRGKEVFDAITGSEINPTGLSVGSGQDSVKGGPEGDTLMSGNEGNGPIAQSLGIDFHFMEQQYGLPTGFLERTAFLESTGDPNAQNPESSAGGLFQQIDSNAKAYGVRNRFDPVQSTQGAVDFAVENVRTLTKALGRPPSGAELYLAHQQGGAGARRLLTNQDALAVDIVGEDAVRLNGGNVNMTAGEFANIWISKFNGGRGPTSFAQAVPPAFKIDSGTAPAGSSVGTGAPKVEAPPQRAVQAPQSMRVEAPATTPAQSKEELVAKAKELLASRPMDNDIKALIEALTNA